MRTWQLTHPDALVKGELLLKPGHEVPAGPPDARAAWGRETGDLVEVLQVEERESGLLDVLLASVYRDDRRVLERAEMGEYERLDGAKVGFGAPLEAASDDPGTYLRCDRCGDGTAVSSLHSPAGERCSGCGGPMRLVRGE